MKIQEKSITEISKHAYLRFDCKYWRTQSQNRNKNAVLLKDLFTIVTGSVQTNSYTVEQTDKPYVRIGDISYKYGIVSDDIIYLNDSCDIPTDKILQENDLVLATIGATVGKVGIADDYVGGTFSNNTVCLRAKPPVNAKFYEKLLQTDKYISYVFGVVSQKAQPNLQQYDLENILLPQIDSAVSDRVVNAIKTIENDINALKMKIKTPKSIIDEVFAHEFGLSTDVLYKIANSQNLNISCSNLSFNNSNLRFSTRWNKAGLIQEALLKMTDILKPLEKYISQTLNGFSPECSEGATMYGVLGVDAFSKDTVMKFDNLKYTDLPVSDRKSCFIKNGDFFVSRGNTTDLVALASIAEISGNTEPIMFPDLFIRIDFTDDINKRFLAYVFNSFIGRLYFKYATKGKNQTMVKVSAKELNDFYVPVPSMNEQKRIVDLVQAEINKQDSIKAKISELRGNIDEVIENALDT